MCTIVRHKINKYDVSKNNNDLSSIAAASTTKLFYATKFWNEVLAELDFMSVESLGERNYFKTFFPLERSSGFSYDFTYNDIWKCGNNFFQSRLTEYCNSTVNINKMNNGNFVFSFVRNPMERFISAYREVAFRTTQCCNDIVWTCNFHQEISCDKITNTTHLAIELLTRLFKQVLEQIHLILILYL